MMTTETPTTKPPSRPGKARNLALLITCAVLFVVIAYIGLHKVTQYIDPTIIAAYVLVAAIASYLFSRSWLLVTDDPSAEARVVTAAYESRARILAYLASVHPAVLAMNDPDMPDWWVLYLDTPAGQLSWHIRPEHLRLFPHVEQVTPNDPRAEWDGHTPDEKHQRLDLLIEDAG